LRDLGLPAAARAAFEQRKHLADIRAADRHRDIALRGQQQDAAVALAAKILTM
jgi:hypothetical protein